MTASPLECLRKLNEPNINLYGENKERRGNGMQLCGRLCVNTRRTRVGIKDMRCMNDALLLKLLWKLNLGQNELWIQVLQGKYRRGRERCEALVSKNGNSPLWKEMCRLDEIFKQNTRMEIHNGENTNVWLDQCITRYEPLINYVEGEEETVRHKSKGPRRRRKPMERIVPSPPDPS